jgi:uncharacterized protein (TIGR02391 family)
VPADQDAEVLQATCRPGTAAANRGPAGIVTTPDALCRWPHSNKRREGALVPLQTSDMSRPPTRGTVPRVDTRWALSQLDELQRQIDLCVHYKRLGSTFASSAEEARRAVSRLLVPAQAIARLYYDDWEWPEHGNPNNLTPSVQAIRGHVQYAQEIADRVKPTAPRLAADRLHPWVWGAAQSLWESGHYAEAVSTAARKVNAELQNKVGRRDLSEAKLCSQAFSMSPPTADSPRLRLSGDQETDTWRARQTGALSFGQGCFTAIRNPLAHEESTELSEHEALEQLAAFSILSRWIEASTVLTAIDGQGGA